MSACIQVLKQDAAYGLHICLRAFVVCVCVRLHVHLHVLVPVHAFHIFYESVSVCLGVGVSACVCVYGCLYDCLSAYVYLSICVVSVCLCIATYVALLISVCL